MVRQAWNRGRRRLVEECHLGHTMAKTKFDWSGVADAKKFESTRIGTKKVPAKKAPAKKKANPKTTFLTSNFKNASKYYLIAATLLSNSVFRVYFVSSTLK